MGAHGSREARLDIAIVAGLIVLGALMTGAVVWFFRPSAPAADVALLQQQLVELRRGLDELADGQRSVPHALAEGRAQQAAALSRQFTDFGRSINAQLSSAEQAMGHRLADTGAVVADVRERLGHLVAATERLEQLGTSVAEVQDLLRVPKLRGTLGEVWLEELLGQIFPADLFKTQYAFGDGERVDAVIRLGGRLVPVDAKFPLHEGERAASADQRGAEHARRAFRRSVQARVDEIADKYIRPSEDTYDFALMYVPAEKIYYEMLSGTEETRPLIEYALNRRVIPVSPNTFYAYLMVILHGLRGLQVETNAREILASLEQVGGELDRGLRAHEIGQRHLERAIRQQREVGERLQSSAARVRQLVEPVDQAAIAAAPPTDHSSPEGIRAPRDAVSGPGPQT